MVAAKLSISAVAPETSTADSKDEDGGGSRGQFLQSPLTEVMKRSSSSCCCSSSRRRREMKCKQLVEYDSLPDFLKHNEFIRRHYRSEWPIRDAVLSIFSLHNETINVWTHLIGFFVFLTLTVGAAVVVGGAPTESSTAVVVVDFHHVGGPLKLYSNLTGAGAGAAAAEEEAAAARMRAARWPFYAYLCGAMFCLLMSSACHLISCHSERTNYLMLRLDYAGITALIVASFYPLVYYSFLCEPQLRLLYLGSITGFGVAAVTVSLAPAFETPEFRLARAGLFVCMGLSGLVPIVHKMVLFGDHPAAVLTTAYEAAMGAFYVLGVVVYATRVPERWMPGKFDLAGHSHQLFHVLVIAGAYSHYLAGLVYLRWRDMEAC